MAFVCPLPRVWHDIHMALCHAWQESGEPGEPPPVPLILAGWAFSNDVDKQNRWRATLRWAEEHGFSHLIPPLAERDSYRVNQLSNYEIGPGGGPMYLPWRFEPATRPSPEGEAQAIQALRVNWPTIAGDALARATEPLALTGRKRRRLLVHVRADCTPPWGTWTHLAGGETRRTFTLLRRAVNEAIAPLEVDHIDFEV